MFNLSKKTEYGLIALSYLSHLDFDQRANVAEIASASTLPKELLAKILSELVKAGLAQSISGPAGGFRLAKPAEETSLAEIVNALERQPGLVECSADKANCDRSHECSIRSPMAKVQKKVTRILEETMLTDLIAKPRLVGISGKIEK